MIQDHVDTILIELKNYHQIQLDSIDTLDSKAYSLLVAVGIIASFYTGFGTIILDRYNLSELFIFWIISFLSGIFLLIISAYYCLKAIQIEYTIFGPNPKELIPYKEKNRDIFYDELIDGYKNYIEKNSKINYKKAYCMSNAIKLLTYAIFAVLFSAILLILLAINLKLEYSVCILIIILVGALVTFKVINRNEKRKINEFIKQLKA